MTGPRERLTALAPAFKRSTDRRKPATGRPGALEAGKLSPKLLQGSTNMEIIYKAAPYFVRRSGSFLKVCRDKRGGFAAVLSTFPDSPENRARCVKFCDRRALAESKQPAEAARMDAL